MKYLGCFLFLALFTTLETHALRGGKAASSGAHPNVIYLHHPYNSCTGVLIHSRIALTAAHCLSLRPAYGVQGSFIKRSPKASQRNRIVQWRSHPSYKGLASVEDPSHPAYYHAQDIAYVVFERDFENVEKIEVSELTRTSMDEASVLTAVGFGGQRGEVLKKKTLGLRATNFLKQPFHQLIFSTGAGLEGGDSGGPIFDPNNRLVGIASSSSEDSGRSYFGLVHEARDWIERETEIDLGP